MDNEFRNKKILFHCDNAAVVYAVNTMTSKSDKVMTLLRALPLKCLLLNIVAKAKHIPGKYYITDSLSRLQFDKFPDWHHKQNKNHRLFRARFGTYSIYNQRACEGKSGYRYTNGIQKCNIGFQQVKVPSKLGKPVACNSHLCTVLHI